MKGFNFVRKYSIMREEISEYMRRASEILREPYAGLVIAPFGFTIVKGNYKPSSSVDVVHVDNYPMKLGGRTFHERVLLIERNIPIRSHEETDLEIVKNVGDVPLFYIEPESETIIVPGNIFCTVSGRQGFYHGFRIEHGIGLLYVAKILNPEFVYENSFRMPDNTYTISS